MPVGLGVFGVEIHRAPVAHGRGEQGVVAVGNRATPVVLEDAPDGEVFELMAFPDHRELGCVKGGHRTASTNSPTSFSTDMPVIRSASRLALSSPIAGSTNAKNFSDRLAPCRPRSRWGTPVSYS